jgi:hypothetical protein
MIPLQEVSIAALLLISLILPLYASVTWSLRAIRESPLSWIWIGQAFLALGGLLIIGEAVHPLPALALATLGCLASGAAYRHRVLCRKEA